jgi:hypothetical protein
VERCLEQGILHSQLFTGTQTDGDPVRDGEIAMVMIPMVSAAPDKISPDKIKLDENFVSVELVWNFFQMNVKAKHS